MASAPTPNKSDLSTSMLSRGLRRQLLLCPLSRPQTSLPFTCLRTLYTPGTPRRLPRLQSAKFPRFDLSTRKYSDAARSRIEENGVHIQNAEETRHALLAYAEGFWPPPRVVPPGWSADWTKWDYLLTFFGFSPYFLRLPQIEMLVNIRYGVPGAARPLMYSDDGSRLVFAIDPQDPPDETEDAGAEETHLEKVEADGPAVFMLDCSTFELLAFADDGEAAHALPETVDELIERIGADIDSVPYTQLAPDEAGEAALQRVLARDASVIPLLETDFLGYAPKPTTPAEELPDEEAEARRRTKIEAAIADARAFVAETEEELRLDQEDLQELGEGGVLNIELEQEANRRMTAALDDAKAKLAKWEALYQQSYGGENKAS